MFPGGFSAGDEPDGSAKFFATAFQKREAQGSSYGAVKRAEMVLYLVSVTASRHLIKLGLVPDGEIIGQPAAGFSDTDIKHHWTPCLQDGILTR